MYDQLCNVHILLDPNGISVLVYLHPYQLYVCGEVCYCYVIYECNYHVMHEWWYGS